MQTANGEELMDMMDVARDMGVSRSTVQRYVDNGILQPVPFSEFLQRPKKHWFRKEDVEALKEQRRAEVAKRKAND